MRILSVFLLTLLFGAVAVAQKKPLESAPNLALKSDKSVGACRSNETIAGKYLKTMTFSVLERTTGHRVGGVTKNDLILTDDGQEREVEILRQVREPLSIVLLIDTSPSTENLFRDILIAANRLLAKLSPNDELSIWTFDGTIRESVKRQKVSAITRDLSISRDAPGTRLFDAVDLAIKKQFKSATGRKVLIIFSDGEDTTSQTATEKSNLHDAVEADARVYAVQYPYMGNIRPSINSYFTRLAEITGGSSVIFDDIRKSPEKFNAILNDAAAVYTACYWADASVSKKISLKLRENNPSLLIRIQ